MIRTTLQFAVVGKSKDELESKIKERVAKYLAIDKKDVEELPPIDIQVTMGEEEPMNLSFAAQCIVKFSQ